MSLIKEKRTVNKIIAIQGSYRDNGITTMMLKYAVEKTKAQDNEVTYIKLHEKKIEYCKGCRKCFDSAECFFKNDDLHEVAHAIKEADVIMLATPVYWANVPAVVKNLFDRMSGTSMMETKTFPKPRFKGKRYILFTACNTPMPFAKWCGQTTGLKRAVKEYFKTSGVECIGTVICANTGLNKAIPYKKIDRIIGRKL